MSELPRIAHIVSHTHWDREWYRTFHTYRVWLSRVVGQVLDALENDPAFEHFLLDGQAIILEDYLEIHPEDEERIRAHVRAGRLSIGPWYILPDEFLISAESAVRNLLVGHKVCSRFGGWNTAGYMPDSFGHVAQTPQLLRQAGIDSFIYWRGNGDEIDSLGLEYTWAAPDGSEVLAIQQAGGYCNAAGLGHCEIWHAHTRKTVDHDLAVKKVGALLGEIAARSNSDVALVNNGCDHFPPQRDFGAILARLREAMPGVEFRHSDLASFLGDVRRIDFPPKRFRGELISGKLAHILSGVWSARMYLKQLNDRCQTLLASQLEPLSAYSHFMHGRAYPSGLIEYAWKLLLKNHPHDSICGCSIDEVHADMLPRFRGVIETGEEAIVRQMESLAPEFARADAGDADTVLCVVNPLPMRRSAVVERLVILQPCCAEVAKLRLIDERGREVPFQILSTRHVERFWGVDYRLHLTAEEQLAQFEVYRRDFGPRILKDRIETQYTDRYVHIQFMADDLPGVGHTNYRLTDKPSTERAQTTHEPVRVDGPKLENAFCRVEVHPNGTFDLTDKRSGRVYRGLNLLEDTEDVGDEYDYSPCTQSETITTAQFGGTIHTGCDSGLIGTLEVSLGFALPTGIDADRKSRARGRRHIQSCFQISLSANSPVVDIRLTIENSAEDHRLRAVFPTDIQTDVIHSDGHFYTNERPIDRPNGADWVQPSPRTWPQQDFSLLQDERGGLALFNRGLPEIEAIKGDHGGVGLALTLLRCVGWLSRDDFPTRRNQNAGPTVATPGAQCPGPHAVHYAVMPFSGDWLEAGVKRAGQLWRVPPMVVQGVKDLQSSGGGLVETTSARVCVTAVKKHEMRNTLVIRLYNLDGGPVHETLLLGRPIRAAWRLNLLEDRKDELHITDPGRIEVDVAGHRIETLELAFVGRDKSCVPALV